MSGNFSKTHVKDGTATGARSSTAELPLAHVADQALLLESLSALMDDQADELELRRILKAMPADANLEAKWQRYHVVRSSLQLETHSRPEVNLLAAINARFVAESISHPKQATFGFSNPVFRYIGQGAIAASFFAITIIGTSVFNRSGSDVQPMVADAANLDTPVLGGEYRGSELARTASASMDGTLDEEALARLSQAVQQEFSGTAAAVEIPVSYTLELPATDTQTP